MRVCRGPLFAVIRREKGFLLIRVNGIGKRTISGLTSLQVKVYVRFTSVFALYQDEALARNICVELNSLHHDHAMRQRQLAHEASAAALKYGRAIHATVLRSKPLTAKEARARCLN